MVLLWLDGGTWEGLGQGAEPGAVRQKQTLQVQGRLLALKDIQRVELRGSFVA